MSNGSPHQPGGGSLGSRVLSGATTLVATTFEETYTKPVASYRRLPLTDRIKIVAAAILVLGSAAIYWAEVGEPGANIKDLPDAVWWTVVTMATVGYGDRYPVTDLGRIIATLVILGGCSTLCLAIAYYGGTASDADKAANGEVDTIEELRDELRRRDEVHALVLRRLEERIAQLTAAKQEIPHEPR